MNRKINKNFLIIGAMILATVLAFFLISIFSKNNQAINPGVVTEAALKEEILQLESNLLELELVFSEKDDQVENFETLLDEKYVELDNMNQKVRNLENKIDQLEREGKVDKRTIREMREKLANARGKFVENLKGEINILVYDLSRLTQTNDSLDILAEEQQSEIETMRKEYNECLTANTSSSPQVDPPVIPVKDTRARFQAINLRVVAKDKDDADINKDGKKAFNLRKTDKLEFKFNLQGIGDVAQGEYPLYIVLRSRKGPILIGNDSGSGKQFVYQGQTLQATRQINATFVGGTQDLTAKFDDAKALKKAEKGRHDLLVYLQRPNGESELIGENNRVFIN